VSTWLDLANDNRIAAQELLGAGRFRSSVSRSYYAVYCGLAHLLQGKVSYPFEWNNPPHARMGSYIVHNLDGLPILKRRRVRTLVSILRSARTAADYMPGWSCDKTAVREARMSSEAVLKEIGIP
jgi:hypothetical protein